MYTWWDEYLIGKNPFHGEEKEKENKHKGT